MVGYSSCHAISKKFSTVRWQRSKASSIKGHTFLLRHASVNFLLKRKGCNRRHFLGLPIQSLGGGIVWVDLLHSSASPVDPLSTNFTLDSSGSRNFAIYFSSMICLESRSMHIETCGDLLEAQVRDHVQYARTSRTYASRLTQAQYQHDLFDISQISSISNLAFTKKMRRRSTTCVIIQSHPTS